MTNGKLYPCEGGYICDPCLQRHREGTDSSTRVAKASQWSMGAQAAANRLRQRGEMEVATQYELRADQEAQQAVDQTPVGLQIEMAMGEVVPSDRLDIRDTLTAPDPATDASARRIDLAAQSIGAQDEPGEHAPFAKDNL